MKILVLGLDQKILEADSAVAKRATSYGKLLEEYFIVVPGENKTVDLSKETKVVSISAGNKFLTLFKIYRYLADKLKNNKYDLITIQDTYYLASIGVNLANKFDIKIEIQVHGFEKLEGFRRILVKSNLQKADKIRVVSQRLKKKIIDEFNIKEDKIYVVPVAIDKERILNVESSFNLKEKYPESFIFLTVARLVAVKNIAMQIRALANIEDKHVKLIIVGDGPEKDNLKNLVKELNIEGRVIFVDWVNNLVDYYKTADCLLLSSDSEGYGMVVSEAILAGLPVIMTDVGVAGELVENNVNGLMVPVGDEESFVEAMRKVIEEDGLLQQLSVNTLSFKDKILDKEELINKVVDSWKKI